VLVSLQLLDPGVQNILQIAGMGVVAPSQRYQLGFHLSLKLGLVLEELLEALELGFVRGEPGVRLESEMQLLLSLNGHQRSVEYMGSVCHSSLTTWSHARRIDCR
jgi:hypothetical protein